ncbi:MAG: 6-carboxytetrahydropterin synthase [Nitrospinota bacterium]|nr:6-carboxytetrahydropterin synthase [Nitrospinota bacterium]
MYKIKIKKEKHNFSAAHFITFENDCESLHGHNYYTSLEMTGSLDENAYLMDFRNLKKELSLICDRLDHKVLLAADNVHQKITKSGGEYEVIFNGSRYVFPTDDVIMLPIENTTVEKLSEFICQSMVESLKAKGGLVNVSSIEVGVEETIGQMASFKISFE